MAKQKNYYDIVGASIADPISLINKRAVKTQQRLEAEGKDTKEFHEAWTTLSDKAKKEQYDERSGIADQRRAIKVPTNFVGISDAAQGINPNAINTSRTTTVKKKSAMQPSLTIDKPRSGSGASEKSQGSTDKEDISTSSSPANSPRLDSIRLTNNEDSLFKKTSGAGKVYVAAAHRRSAARHNATKKGGAGVRQRDVHDDGVPALQQPVVEGKTISDSKGPTVVEKQYERDGGNTRIKFKDVQDNYKTIDSEVLKAIENERSLFTKLKAAFNHQGYLTEKETRAVEALDKSGKKDTTSVQQALKNARRSKWFR